MFTKYSLFHECWHTIVWEGSVCPWMSNVRHNFTFFLMHSFFSSWTWVPIFCHNTDRWWMIKRACLGIYSSGLPYLAFNANLSQHRNSFKHSLYFPADIYFFWCFLQKKSILQNIKFNFNWVYFKLHQWIYFKIDCCSLLIIITQIL